MARILTMTNKLLSLRGQIDICDANGTQQYLANGKFSWLHRRWQVRQRDQEVAFLESKMFSWRSGWRISGSLGNYMVRRASFWSIRRRYLVEGGPIDGAILKGNFFDKNFAIERGGVTLARASSSTLSMRERHDVEILQDNAELPCVIAMLVVLLDRRAEAQVAVATGD